MDNHANVNLKLNESSTHSASENSLKAKSGKPVPSKISINPQSSPSVSSSASSLVSTSDKSISSVKATKSQPNVQNSNLPDGNSISPSKLALKSSPSTRLSPKLLAKSVKSVITRSKQKSSPPSAPKPSKTKQSTPLTMKLRPRKPK